MLRDKVSLFCLVISSARFYLYTRVRAITASVHLDYINPLALDLVNPLPFHLALYFSITRSLTSHTSLILFIKAHLFAEHSWVPIAAWSLAAPFYQTVRSHTRTPGLPPILTVPAERHSCALHNFLLFTYHSFSQKIPL